jgi:hypothetical protein
VVPTSTLGPDNNRKKENEDRPVLTQPSTAGPQETAVAVLNYLRRGGKDKRVNNTDGPAKNSRTPKEAAIVFRRWELDGEYEPKKIFSSKTATTIKAHDGQKPAVAIVLLCNRATHIGNALCAGREYHTIKRTAGAKIKELKAQQAQAGTQEFLRKNVAMIRKLDDDIDEVVTEWGKRWRATDKLLDIVWVNAAILAPRDDDLLGGESGEHIQDTVLRE